MEHADRLSCILSSVLKPHICHLCHEPPSPAALNEPQTHQHNACSRWQRHIAGIHNAGGTDTEMEGELIVTYLRKGKPVEQKVCLSYHSHYSMRFLLSWKTFGNNIEFHVPEQCQKQMKPLFHRAATSCKWAHFKIHWKPKQGEIKSKRTIWTPNIALTNLINSRKELISKEQRSKRT